MHARETPRTIPDKPRYFVIEIPGMGHHHFKTPMPLYCAQLTSELDRSGLSRFAGMSGKERKKAEKELEKQIDWGGLIELWKIAGAALGMAWFHETIDLDTVRESYGNDLSGYGEAVLDELFEDGYDLKALSPAFVELMGKFKLAIIGSAKVAERADFSEAPEATSS